MKLICVNADVITLSNCICTGQDLVLGQEYETNCKPYVDENGHDCYFIVGLGGRLKCRFSEPLSNNENKEELEEQLNEALDKEDYVLASELRDKLKHTS